MLHSHDKPIFINLASFRLMNQIKRELKVHVVSQGYPDQKAKGALQVVMEEMISMLVKKEKLVLMEDQEK